MVLILINKTTCSYLVVFSTFDFQNLGHLEYGKLLQMNGHFLHYLIVIEGFYYVLPIGGNDYILDLYEWF